MTKEALKRKNNIRYEDQSKNDVKILGREGANQNVS